MTLQEELERQRAINIKLRRQLEKCRRDTVEYCAKFCESHEVLISERGSISIIPETKKYIHEGDYYAQGLRGIIGK